MLLRAAVIADPVRDVALRIADQCDRLAEQRHVANTAEGALDLVTRHKPEIALVSLELNKSNQPLIKTLRASHATLCIVGMYRELDVSALEKVQRLGIDELVEQPVDITGVYRVASKHFGRPFRRHERFAVALDVFRADGVVIGKTRDLSEGGLLMDAIHPVAVNDSMLLSLPLPDGNGEPLRARCDVVSVSGVAPRPVTAGIQFHRLFGRERDRLANFLRQLEAAR